MRLKIHHSKPTISNREVNCVSKVLKSSYIASGKITDNFQNKFAKLIRVNSALATNSGTSALHLALLALKVNDGNEVILPSYVCSCVLNAVLYRGAKPKIVDINTTDFNICLKDTQKNISQRTKAIILPHMFGKPVNINGFLKLGIPVIENCAQSLGAKYRERATGRFGTISIFSFYATKLISTGYGGMVCSKDKRLIQIARDLIEVDNRDNYKIRLNYKMSDISAALGISQLRQLRTFIAKRRAIAAFYNKNLKSANILLPQDRERNHIYFRYVVRAKGNANRIITALNKRGIEVKRPVFKPLHRYLKLNKGRFPNTEAVHNSAISLPIYPSLKTREAKHIADTLRELV